MKVAYRDAVFCQPWRLDEARRYVTSGTEPPFDPYQTPTYDGQLFPGNNNLPPIMPGWHLWMNLHDGELEVRPIKRTVRSRPLLPPVLSLTPDIVCGNSARTSPQATTLQRADIQVSDGARFNSAVIAVTPLLQRHEFVSNLLTLTNRSVAENQVDA